MAQASPGGDELTTRPRDGRTFAVTRAVRLGDASPNGRLRLDAMATYAQDIATDDSRDTGLPDADAWVVRRSTIEVHRFPVYGEELALTTWCSGTGSRWADRRTEARGAQGGHVECVTVWVAVDLTTGRPRLLGDDFAAVYGAAANGRVVTARLRHAPPPSGGGAVRRPWPLRFADFDVLGHVNNAAYWVAAEEVLAGRRDLRAPLRAELEFHQAVERDTPVELVTADRADGVDAWLVGVATGAVHASIVVGMRA